VKSYIGIGVKMTDLDAMEYNGKTHNGEETEESQLQSEVNDDNCPGDDELWGELS
jgi:hypothetical protein